jgi:hypothetical protein
VICLQFAENVLPLEFEFLFGDNVIVKQVEPSDLPQWVLFFAERMSVKWAAL